MSDQFVEQLQKMHELKLYSNLIPLCSLCLCTVDQNPGLISDACRIRILTLYSDSLFHLRRFDKAESVYTGMLLLCKNSGSQRSNALKAIEIEVKYRLYECYMALRQRNTALSMLQSIGVRQRNAKINMALGNLYRDAGMQRAAISCYKEVVKDCPLSLDAIEQMLKLGVKGVEVNALTVCAVDEPPLTGWMSTWLKAQAQLHSQDAGSAIKTLKTLDTYGRLKNSPLLCTHLGYSYHFMQDRLKAIDSLKRALTLDSYHLEGMDLLSGLLAISRDDNTSVHCLQKMTDTLIGRLDMVNWNSTHWTILGNCMLGVGKLDRAVYYGQQALLLDDRNVEALLMKARVLRDYHKFQDCVNHCTRAIQLAPLRLDIYECCIKCLLETRRLRQAERVALSACQALTKCSNAVMLLARVVVKETKMMTKSSGSRNGCSNTGARPSIPPDDFNKMFEMAMKSIREQGTNSKVKIGVIYLLGEYLASRKLYEEAIEFLKRSIDECGPTTKLHRMLGDYYAELKKEEDAFQHYTQAWRLDMRNERALRGLNKLGHNRGAVQNNSGLSIASPTAPSTSTGRRSSRHSAITAYLINGNVPNDDFDSFLNTQEMDIADQNVDVNRNDGTMEFEVTLPTAGEAEDDSS